MPIYQSKGFTLLEMLIALAIFSLVSMTAASLLYQAVEAQSVSARLGDRLIDIERGLGRLSRDVGQYVSRQARDEFGDLNPALLLSPGSIEFTRQGWANPAEHARSELQRVRYWVEENRLLRAYWDVLDRGPESTPRIQTLIEGVSRIGFEPITASQILRDDPFSYSSVEEEAPIGVRILIQVEGYGELIRIIDLPGQMAVAGAERSESDFEDELGAAHEIPSGRAHHG